MRARAILAVALSLAGPLLGADSQEKVRVAVAKVFDTSILHRIEIVIPSVEVPALLRRTDVRLHCTFTFDGVTLKDVGVRQAGGLAHPYVMIDGKPSLSIKFNEFVKGQKLHGLEKLVLKNELQDMSFVNEHLTYEVFRRAGLTAPTTAHAVVTINGRDSGIYLMREPIGDEFLLRNFGPGFDQGNLYEVEYARTDPVLSPSEISLKDEVKDNRSRADLLAMAAAVRSSTPGMFRENVGRHVDLPRYATYNAVEAVTSYFDGFSFNTNNSYLYFHPRDGKMIILPSGADETFWAGVSQVTRMVSTTQWPRSSFGSAARAAPGFEQEFLAEVDRVRSAAVWDKEVLLERVAQVAKVLATAERTGRTAQDLARFESFRPRIEAFIKAGGTPNFRR